MRPCALPVPFSFHGKRLVACYGEIRSLLESKGKTIGPLDMLIAAHALGLDLTIISKQHQRIFENPESQM